MELNQNNIPEIINILDKLMKGDPLINISNLQQYEKMSGYITILQVNFNLYYQNISENTTISEDIRLNSIIQLKNFINRYWKSIRQSIISNDEKIFVRNKLLLQVQNSSPIILRQLAIIISRIARFEFGKWPELFPSILNAILTKDKNIFPKYVYTLRVIIKELSHLHLPAQVHMFRKTILDILTSELFLFYQEIVASILQNNMEYDIIFYDFTKVYLFIFIGNMYNDIKM